MDSTFLRTALRKFINVNRRISSWQGAVAHRLGRRCGKHVFHTEILPSLLRPRLRVLDVGGGKRPAIDRLTKQRLSLHVVGLDISAEELENAPYGAYDATIVGDITQTAIQGSYDLIFSTAVLEHVTDTRSAIANMVNALTPGGTMAHFVPCRNAAYAIVNRWIGQELKRKLLHGIYPDTRHCCGFPAFYDRCDPAQFRQMCEDADAEVVAVQPYYFSDYLAFLTPAYTVELCRQMALMGIGATNLAETFTIVARRPVEAEQVLRRAA